MFLPKGSKPNDSFEVVRAPEDTRPLGLKNTDNKIVAGTLVHTFRASMQKSTHRTQRGPQPSGAGGRQATSTLLRRMPRGLIAAVLAAAARRPGDRRT